MTADQADIEVSEFVQTFHKLGQFEQVVLMAGLRALVSRAFDIDTFIAWSQDLIDRHRRGEELRLSDLQTPPAPPAG